MSRLAEKQFGRIGRRQLRNIGVSNALIGRWLRDAYLVWVVPGVFGVGHVAPSIEGELAAALLYACPGSYLSHATAAWWWGLLEDRPTTIDVSSPGRHRSRPGIRAHNRRSTERVWHRDLPVSPLAETLIDYAADASDSDIKHALMEAQFHRLLVIDDVEEALGRGRPGSARVRTALAAHRPEHGRTRGTLERAFRQLCELRVLPVPECNAKVSRMTVDAVWHDQRLAVEVDGRDGHSAWAQIKRDRRRELALRALGYTVIRYTWDQVTKQQHLVAADLANILTPAQRCIPDIAALDGDRQRALGGCDRHVDEVAFPRRRNLLNGDIEPPDR